MMKSLPNILIVSLAVMAFAIMTRSPGAQQFESIAANDNRETGGELKSGVLTLKLELRKGLWHP